MTSARLTLTSVALTAALACSGPPMTAPMNDAGPYSDARVRDGDVDDGSTGFDPSVTYPGEGERCEFSLFCSELQICVDGECARHERFEEGDLAFGTLRRIPHDMLRTSSLYTEATVDWDMLRLSLFGEVLPGPAGPRLTFFRYGICQVVIYGEGPPRIVYVPELSCATVGISPDGHVLLGGMQTYGADEQPRWALLAPDGQLLAEGGYPATFFAQVQEAAGDPDIRLFTMTSILWHEGRFLFSASASVPTTSSGDMLLLGGPENPTHTFFGELSLDGSMQLLDVAGSVAHAGSFGWIVRDERGLHSIMTVFNMPVDPTEMRIDLLSWETGERQVLAPGPAGSAAGTSRHSRPYPDQWGMSSADIHDRCSEELFENGEHAGRMQFTPEEECPELPFSILRHGNKLGASSPYGVAFTGHPDIRWLATDRRTDRIVLRSVDHEVGVLSNGDPRVNIVGNIHPISRFGKTLEVFASPVYEMDEMGRLSCWELPLSRRVE